MRVFPFRRGGAFSLLVLPLVSLSMLSFHFAVSTIGIGIRRNAGDFTSEIIP